MKLSTRLLLSMAGIVMAVVLGAGFMVYRLFTPLLEAADASDLRSSATLVENLQRSRLESQLQMARKLASASSVRASLLSTPGAPGLVEPFDDAPARSGEIVVLLRADGSLAGGPGRGKPAAAALAAHAFTRGVLAAAAYAAGVVRVDGTVHGAAVATVGTGDRVLGAVLVAVPVDDAFMQELAQATGGVVVLFHGSRSAASGAAESGTAAPPAAELASAMQGTAMASFSPIAEGHGATGNAGQMPIRAVAVGSTTYRAVSGQLHDPAGDKLAWYLLMKSMERSQHVQRWLTRYLTLIGSLAIGLAALLSLWLARATAAPIQELARRLREVEGLETMPGVEERDEIEVIAQKLREMLATLRLKQEEELAVQKAQLQQAEARANEQTALKRATEEYIALIEQLAGGNLTVRFREDGPPEMGRLGRHLNLMVRHVSQIISDVQDAVAHLSSASTEILGTLTQQVENYRFQDDALSRTGLAIEQLRKTASLTAEEADKVVDRTGASNRAFQEADGAARATVATMEEISIKAQESSKSMRVLLAHIDKIDHIVSAVNEIAEQSNLLSLNAAIEAARAAEVGRGFAVVAQEVRNLAVQSKQCTGEIKKILGDVRSASDTVASTLRTAADEVTHGAGLMNQVRNLQESLRQTLDDSMQLAAKVKTASTSQAKELDGLTRGMKDAIQRLGQNFASVQAIREALKDLSSLSVSLRDASATFTVEESPPRDLPPGSAGS